VYFVHVVGLSAGQVGIGMSLAGILALVLGTVHRAALRRWRRRRGDARVQPSARLRLRLWLRQRAP
ncbi:hypothetical protein ABT232_35830, partial [Streptomyces sp. NPDC001532]|uniref:hypothetical protein n=1 Tax=Streptomyces sp. NPDC001532 TaxID=3154520 RepID=UPI0033255CB6